MEAHHHVGELDAGVVDVVLDLDRVAEGAQGAHQNVAQDGVSQVADVGRLVGVDVGVLDDHLPGVGGVGGIGGIGSDDGRSSRRAATSPRSR